MTAFKEWYDQNETELMWGFVEENQDRFNEYCDEQFANWGK